MLPTDYLGIHVELHPVVDWSYEKGTWGNFFMCHLKTIFSQFYVSVEGHFKSLCIEHMGVHNHEMEHLVKALQNINKMSYSS